MNHDSMFFFLVNWDYEAVSAPRNRDADYQRIGHQLMMPAGNVIEQYLDVVVHTCGTDVLAARGFPVLLLHR